MKILFLVNMLFILNINAQTTDQINSPDIKNFLLKEYNLYAKECNTDTIYAKSFPEMFEYDLEFLVKYHKGESKLLYLDKKGKRKYTTDLKLLNRGYKLARIKYLNEDDQTLGYIWIYVMQPNFNGFIKWLRGDMPIGEELED